MKKNIIRTTLFITILFLTNIDGYSQNLQPKKIFKQEKISIGIGVGVDYSIIGPKFRLKLKDNLYAISSFSRVLSNLGTIGLEYQLPIEKNSRICPYTFVQFGHDVPVRLWDQDFQNETIKTFNSMNFGLASKFQIFKGKRNYLSAGISYRFYGKSKINDFLLEFNEEQNGSGVYIYDQVLFTIGYNFILF